MANSSLQSSEATSTPEAGQSPQSVEVIVTVHRFEEAPDYLREALATAKELFKRRNKLSKVKSKTIGAMRVTFSEGNPATIIAVSGLGSNEWKTPGDTVSLGEEIKKDFEDKQMHLADITNDRTEIRLIKGDIIPLEDRGSFMALFEQRMKEKQSRLRDALGKLSLCEKEKKKIIRDALITSAEYSPTTPERDFEECVNFYFGLLSDDTFLLYLSSLNTALELLLSDDPQEECRKQLQATDSYRFCQVESLLENKPGLNAQSFADECCKPAGVPEGMLSQYLLAFRFIEYKPTERLANLSVQCAEDNAISCLCEIKGSRIIKIEWVSVTLKKGTFEFENKPLCAVCKVGFIPRAKQINNLPN